MQPDTKCHAGEQEWPEACGHDGCISEMITTAEKVKLSEGVDCDLMDMLSELGSATVGASSADGSSYHPKHEHRPGKSSTKEDTTPVTKEQEVLDAQVECGK
eukprot:2681856-Amphidinium_carterae.1